MLHKIALEKKKEVESLYESTSIAAFERQLAAYPAVRPFIKSLVTSRRPVSVISEVKKASPSKGLIRPDFHPVRIAEEYEKAGAEAISVLTDELFFQGSTQFLRDIREKTGTPLLRKDFIIDPIQVYQARSIGADCILLIAAMLEPKVLIQLHALATELGMDVLIEVHDRAELDTVLSNLNPGIIGINNRDLKTFETNLATTEALITHVPKGLPVVSESGIHSPADIERLKEMGVRAVLVGEHFMRQQDVAAAVRELVGV